MAVTYALTTGVSFGGSLTSDTAGQPGSAQTTASSTVTFTNGTGATAIDDMVAGDVTIGIGATALIDLAGDAAFKDGLGKAVTFAKVRALSLVVTAGAGPCRIGGASNTFGFGMGAVTNTFDFYPMFYTGRTDATALAVTAGTGDVLALTNSGADAMTVRYGIAGE